jgi:hypothetical protein
MTDNPLSQIPDRLLRRDETHRDRIRARALIQWCEQRHWRPTLLDLETERARRNQENR